MFTKHGFKRVADNKWLRSDRRNRLLESIFLYPEQGKGYLNTHYLDSRGNQTEEHTIRVDSKKNLVHTMLLNLKWRRLIS